MDTCNPVALYCEIHTACYLWLSASQAPWTAADATRLAISVYLVSTGVRPAYRTEWGGAPNWEEAAQKYLQPRGLSVVKGDADTLYILGTKERPVSEGYLLGNVYPTALASEKHGTITWVCCPGKGGDIALWSEPIGKDADLLLIEAELRRLQNAVRPLGFTAQVRIE